MTVVVYPAIITAAPAGPLQGRFVDFPGHAVSGATPGELISAAREVLSAELRRREEQGETWPDPSPIHALETRAGESVVLVDVSVDDTPIRLTISLGERLLKRIDQDAEARSMTRSGYLALGARGLLGDRPEPFGGVGGETGQKLQEEIAALGRRVNETLGPQSPVGRTLAELDAMALDGLRRLGGEMRSVMGRRHAGGGPQAGRTRDETNASEAFPT